MIYGSSGFLGIGDANSKDNNGINVNLGYDFGLYTLKDEGIDKKSIIVS